MQIQQTRSATVSVSEGAILLCGLGQLMCLCRTVTGVTWPLVCPSKLQQEGTQYDRLSVSGAIAGLCRPASIGEVAGMLGSLFLSLMTFNCLTLIYTEDDGRRFHRNVGTYLQNCTVSRSVRSPHFLFCLSSDAAAKSTQG
jgi:hypothetical protein